MKVEGIKDIVGVTIMKDIIEKTAGEGMQGDFLFDAVMKSIQDGNYSENKEENVVRQNSGYGQRLDDIPVVANNNRNMGQVLVSIDKNSEQLKRSTSEIETKEKVDFNEEKLGDEKSRIYNAVNKYSEQYGVDPKLILAIIKQESNFDPNAESYAGAKGLMQLMDFNSEAYGISNPFDIEANIEGGVRHIKSYLDMYNGNVEMALMAYNGGPGTMSQRGVKSASDLYKMPEETQNYVPKVINYYKNGF